MLISILQDPVAIELVECHHKTLDSYFRPIFYAEHNPPPEYIRFLAGWIIFSKLNLRFTTPDTLARLVGLNPGSPCRIHVFRYLHVYPDSFPLAQKFLMNGTGPYRIDLPKHCADLTSRCIDVM